ncbi:ribosomal protein L11 methyltransferase [Prosthecobacter fusiformis]|uniref:Ribosomal protein L11 methyltransferase n=1 Tax=Prosthecobacter fusiformis TaxID=48464 RepID=A0A4R7S6L1_9BACT|nr:50S ribosomal protein L11 methyltransferase [Prosthecobacter fusiformis]TDU72837.1 ribosomal protein L11 methyltransferase [Prosthecobacter fusiformis]
MFVWSKLSSEKWSDAWEERFAGNPALSLVITTVPGRTTIRVEAYAEKRRDVTAVQKMFGGSVREIKNRNWAALSSEPLPPIQVRGKLVVCSARTVAEYKKAQSLHAGKQVIAIPADMAFGTGHHATTATVLRMLVDAASPLLDTKWKMADLGCGSGILAIAAAKLGASKVWGCDFDPKAVEVSQENAIRNGTPDIKFTETDVLKWKAKEQYDIVIANIFYDILEAGFPQIVRAVRPGGTLMVSGILKSQAAPCLAVASDLGVTWDRIVTRGKWVSASGTVPA